LFKQPFLPLVLRTLPPPRGGDVGTELVVPKITNLLLAIRLIRDEQLRDTGRGVGDKMFHIAKPKASSHRWYSHAYGRSLWGFGTNCFVLKNTPAGYNNQ